MASAAGLSMELTAAARSSGAEYSVLYSAAVARVPRVRASSHTGMRTRSRRRLNRRRVPVPVKAAG
ncbi:hypothetical protein GA0115255_114784 [Streptomyces sp. Ncost-T6T-2b]|nr:hypothetical protein GA0115255_114784 [Streptomyces sp. Ncost-T6T-2b]